MNYSSQLENTTDLGANTINLLSLFKPVMNHYLITHLNIINYPYLNSWSHYLKIQCLNKLGFIQIKNLLTFF